MPRTPDTTPSFTFLRRRFIFAAPFIPGTLAQIGCTLYDPEGKATETDQRLFDSLTTISNW